jgi:hypothetical protein
VDSLDFIIEIDGNIAVGSIISPQIKIVSNDKTDIVAVSYYPGNLSMSVENHAKLLSDQADSIFLVFAYYEYPGGKQKTYNYELRLEKAWLQDYFNILRIYNLDKPRYKGLYDPISKDKNYTYELVSPSHTFLRIQKKGH